MLMLTGIHVSWLAIHGCMYSCDTDEDKGYGHNTFLH